MTLVKFGAATSQISGYTWMEAEVSDDLQIIGTVLEDQDYLEKITKLQGYLDEVKVLPIKFLSWNETILVPAFAYGYGIAVLHSIYCLLIA